MAHTLFLGSRVLAFDKALILSLATSRGSWCCSGTDVTASVPLRFGFGLVAGGSADQVRETVCALGRGFLGRDTRTWLVGRELQKRLLSIARAPVAWR
jgi:hypothetical protein